MKKIILIMGLMVLLIMTPLTSAYFPVTHTYLISETCKQQYNTELSRMCCNDEKACIAGNLLADISVIYYLERGLKKYTVTHSDIFCRDAIAQSRNPTEEALAAGICLHQISDIYSHNVFVPYAIEHTSLPNIIVHPFVEQKIDNYINKISPQSRALLDSSLENSQQYAEFIQRVLQPNKEYSDINVRNLITSFLQQVKNSNTGYDVSFSTLKMVPISLYIYIFLILVISISGILLIMYKTKMNFSTITSLIILSLIALIIISAILMTLTGVVWRYFTVIASPISNFVPTSNIEIGIKNTEGYIKNLFIYGIDYFNTLPEEMRDATGIKTIRYSEQESKTLRWIILTIIGIISALLIYFDIKSKK